MAPPEIDTDAARCHFSAECFNRVWDLLEQTDRSTNDDTLMISMCHASLFHWQQQPDCTPRKLSISRWRLSRVYAVPGQPKNARQFGLDCHRHGQNEGPFCVGYAYEALTRAAVVAGIRDDAEHFPKQAHDQAPQVTDTTDRELLEKDLGSLQHWARVGLNLLLERQPCTVDLSPHAIDRRLREANDPPEPRAYFTCHGTAIRLIG